MPTPVIAGVVSVGDIGTREATAPAGSIAVASPKSSTFGDLLRNRQRLIHRNRTTRDALRQILAFDQFHDRGGDVRSLLEALDRRDVRMVEGREDFGFPVKAREAIRIDSEGGGQHLERHRTASGYCRSRDPPAPI